MKKFTKLFLSCAAVAAVTAAVATSAMAADYLALDGVARTEGETTDTIAITLPATYTDAQKTLVILKPTADKTNIADTDILQIDQDANIVSAVVPHLDETEDAGTYTVLMGGSEGKIYEGTFTVGAAGESIVIGDTNGTGDLATNDATFILRKIGNLQGTQKAGLEYKLTEALGEKKVAGDKLVIGDTNLDDGLATNDATFVLRKIGNLQGTQFAGVETKGVPAN